MEIQPHSSALSHSAKNPSESAVRTYLFGRLNSPHSRRSQTSALDIMARILSNGAHGLYEYAWHALTYQDAMLLKTFLAERTHYKPATINRFLSALRGVVEECWRLELMPVDTKMRIQSVQSVKSTGAARQKSLVDQDMIAEIIKATNSEKHFMLGARDRAMIAIMYQAGLRRSEIAALTAKDIEIERGRLYIADSKGGKSRYVFVSGNTLSHLRVWWQLRAPESESDAVFVGFSKSGGMNNVGITAQTVYDRLAYYCKRVGIEDVAPHHLRHAAITNMLHADVDVLTVAKVVGHSSADTTRVYDRRGDETLQDAAQYSDVPL